MRKIKPLEIGEFTPMTVPEMKNVFGGSGESGESGEKCANPDSICMVSYSVKDPNKYLRNNIPLPKVPTTQFGFCKTDNSGSWTGSSGATVSGIAACDCKIGTVPSYDSGEIAVTQDCAQKK